MALRPKSEPTRPKSVPGRRGRPAVGTETERRNRVLDAALEVLVDDGAERLTMAAVARRAGASKETLYRWFGDRLGLLTALIQRNADLSAQRLAQRLAADGPHLTRSDVDDTLRAYVVGLLSLLTGAPSVALNRAAMSDPTLRQLLLSQGRHRVGPIVESYLALAETEGVIECDSVGGPAGAFELLYGLAVRDTQIRVLLGENPPTAKRLHARAEDAVRQLFVLCAPKTEQHP